MATARASEFTYDVSTLRELIESNQMEEIICSAISNKEIKCRINKLKKKTEPVPDGVEWKHLQGPAVAEALRYLFNTLISGLQPTEWKTNRTTLLPKSGKDPCKAENNGPITIGSY
jgi:hypothetical protein